MLITMNVCMLSMFLGVFVVVFSSSPYFGALGLVVFAGMGCLLMIVSGATFLALVLFLIYLGGMLVVFAYTSALASDPYPEALKNSWAGGLLSWVMAGLGAVGVLWAALHDGSGEEWMSGEENFVLGKELYGVAGVYSGGGGVLVLTAWVMLVMLFVVLELSRGGKRGAIRGV